MAINPDDFIFHSDFQYNYGLAASVPVGASNVNQTLTNGITDGQRYKVVVDDGTTVYQRGGPLAKVDYNVTSGALQAISQPTGTFYYRVYSMGAPFSFLSDNMIEKAVFTAHGTYTMNGNTSFTIPNTYGKKMILFAVWKNKTHAPTLWFTDGQAGQDENDQPVGTLGLSNTNTTITVNFGALDQFVDIEYQIVGVPLVADPKDVYVFNTDKTPLSIPYSITQTIQTSTSLTANQGKVTHSAWFDTGPGTLAMQATITVDNTSRPSIYQDIILASGVSLTVYAQMNTSNQVRIVLVEKNNNSSAVSYTAKTVKVKFDMNHIVPAGTV